jgi:SAM-dependent methyltransferase
MLEWTGERFLPWIRQSTITYEHLHRYAYASTLVNGKRVLDLACGEGYGAKLLATAATFVVGVDIDENVIRHASEKYACANLEFLKGLMAAVPIAEDHSFDAIVCFEAIEHVEDHDAVLAEVTRLLKPDGIFVVSTPNKAIYHDESLEDNPFHLKELYFDEFQQLLSQHFRDVQFLGQRIHPGSSIWPIGAANSNGFREFVMDRGETDFEFLDQTRRVPLYFIAIASNAAAIAPPSGSVLMDQSDGLFQEKDQAAKWAEGQVAEREETIKSLEEALKWREGQLQETKEALTWTQKQANELEKVIASQTAALEWRAGQVERLTDTKEQLERAAAAQATQLKDTQEELAGVTDTLKTIYESRGWRFLTNMRRLRDRLMGRGKARE